MCIRDSQGSGKSTFAQLIPRFYDPTLGDIRFNGVDLRDYKLNSLREAVSLVQQDTFLFTSSVKNNILYGEPWSTGEQVTSAASIAQLHEHIDLLPQGYKTLIGERGVSLSGCLLYTSPSPRDLSTSRMPSSA